MGPEPLNLHSWLIARPDPAPPQASFELFGVDAMVDEDGRVWLLELNADPDIAVFDQKYRHIARVPSALPPSPLPPPTPLGAHRDSAGKPGPLFTPIWHHGPIHWHHDSLFTSMIHLQLEPGTITHNVQPAAGYNRRHGAARLRVFFPPRAGQAAAAAAASRRRRRCLASGGGRRRDGGVCILRGASA